MTKLTNACWSNMRHHSISLKNLDFVRSFLRSSPMIVGSSWYASSWALFLRRSPSCDRRRGSVLSTSRTDSRREIGDIDRKWRYRSGILLLYTVMSSTYDLLRIVSNSSQRASTMAFHAIGKPYLAIFGL